LQVCGDLPADVVGEGQAALARSLATDHDLARAPVEVIELECRYVSGSQTETNQEANDGGITKTHGRRLVKGPEQAIDLIRLERSWQPRQAPAGHRRYAVRKIARDVAADVKEAQERPQPRNLELAVSDAPPASLVPDEVRDVRRGELIPSRALGVEANRSEFPGKVRVATDRRSAQATLSGEVLCVLAQQPINRCFDYGGGSYRDTDPAEVAKQRSKCARRQELRVPLPTPMRQERCHALLGEITELKPVVVEPSAEMSRDQQQVSA
jgi:hypothetical protein